MSHLILHIGLHKTGTTSLQNYCFSMADELAHHGLVYPRYHSTQHPDGVPGHHGLTLNLAQYFPEFAIEGGWEQAWQRLIDEHARSNHTVLISSEEFSRGRQGFRIDIKRLSALAHYFDKVTVACVLREQVSFLQSAFIESTRAGDTTTVDSFLKDAFASNDAAGLWVDRRPLYNHFLSGFQADELHFFDYHSLISQPAGVIGAILGLAGMDYAPNEDIENANISAAPLAYVICYQRFSPAPPPAEALKEVEVAIAAKFGEGRPTTLFTRAEYRAIQDFFAAPNAELVARIRKQQPGFALCTPKIATDMIYREDAAGLV